MDPRTTTYEYTNPRDLEGTPFEVAEVTAKQAVAVLALAERAMNDLWTMGRIAELQRVLEADPEAELDAAGWSEHPLGARISKLEGYVATLKRSTASLARAVSYDPKHPPKA